MTQGWEEQEQVPEVEEVHGLPLANMPVYLQLAQWLHEQGRWVTLPQVMTEFKLSRAQVYSHLVTLRKRFPNSIEEKRKGRGTFSVMSVRMIAGWSMPTKPVKGQPKTCHYLNSVAGMDMPVPRRREDCRWLQLTQRLWSDMRLTRSEVEQVLRCVRKENKESVKEGESGGDM